MSDTAYKKGDEILTGDAAVSGLIAGLLAGLSMAAYLALVAVLSDETILVMLARFDPALEGRWLVGVLAHLAVSSVYGVVFAILLAAILRLRRSLRRFAWLLGLIYGLVLWALAMDLLLPLASSPLIQIAFPHLVVGHAVYGLILGIDLGRRWA